jgi:hypothetical protein
MTENNDLPSKYALANVYEFSQANPREYTYIAIGSNPRSKNLNEFTPKIDQLLPQFLVDEIKDKNKSERTFRIIHIDPYTINSIEFLHEYFKSRSAIIGLEFEYDDSAEMLIWRTVDHRIEIIFLFVSIYHGNDIQMLTVNNLVDDTWFLEKMIETTLNNKYQLFIQEFSGHSIDNTRILTYNKYKNNHLLKNLYLDNIFMYDECHCGIDIDKFSPVLKQDGSFYNFKLYDYNEMKNLIGTNDKINIIIKDYFLKKYSDDLNKHHINYYRRLKNDTLMYLCDEYDQLTPPDLIMKILLEKLDESIHILERIINISDEIKNRKIELFQNYNNFDPHKWRIEVGKLLNLFIQNQ